MTIADTQQAADVARDYAQKLMEELFGIRETTGMAEDLFRIYHRKTAAALAAAEERGRLREREAEPDHCYDVDEWEWTNTWGDRNLLTEELGYGDIMEVGCLKSMPNRFAANVPITFDEDGTGEEYEIQWFKTLEEAQAAIRARSAPQPVAPQGGTAADGEGG